MEGEVDWGALRSSMVDDSLHLAGGPWFQSF